MDGKNSPKFRNVSIYVVLLLNLHSLTLFGLRGCNEVMQTNKCRTRVRSFSHQLNYDLIQEGAEVPFQNATSLYVDYMEVRKINRTLSGLNFAINISDVSRAYEYWVRIDGYEKFGMEHIYRKSAFSYEMQFCKILSGDIMKFNKALNKFGYIMERCEGTKNDVYYVKDFFFDERTPLPPEVPGNNWRFDLKFYSNKDYGQVLMKYYLSIKRKYKFLRPH